MVRIAVVVVLLGLWAPRAHAIERARPMGLYAAAAGTGPALAMVDSRIEITVRGPIVETVVIQRFRNASDHVTEATYIFPLPADAAVSALAIQVGTRTIRAAIEGRDAAQRRYEAAVTAGAPAALLEQERPDVLTQTVSAIPARGSVEVTLRYDTLARYAAGSWELALPMVVAPRYVPGTASGRATTGSGRTPDTDRAPDASRITPAASPGAGGSTAVAIHFADEPAELSSPTHALGGTRRDATFSDPRSDHDALVRWKAPVPSAGWIERDGARDGSRDGARDGDGGFAAVVVEAPAAPAARAAVRVVPAIDRAATTRGDGDAVERPVVRALLDGLGRGDRVHVLGGAAGWVTADAARAAVDRAWAAPAGTFDLTRVLATARPEGAALVLVSDGLVADDPAAIAAARRLGVPIHVIGIGPAPARATLTQIAAASGGTVRFAVTGDDLGALAHATLADIATAPAPLAVNWGTLAASDVEPAVLPRLGAGQAMIVLARIARPQAANARVRGELFAFEALAPVHSVDGATTARGPLARRWARERLGDLLAGKHDRAAVTRLALGYGLVSPYTSLVAVGNDVVVQGGVKHSVAVPVSLPSGMQWHAVKQVIDRETGVETGSLPGPETGVAPGSEPVAPGSETVAAHGVAAAAGTVAPAPDTTTRGAVDTEHKPAGTAPKAASDAPARETAPSHHADDRPRQPATPPVVAGRKPDRVSPTTPPAASPPPPPPPTPKADAAGEQQADIVRPDAKNARLPVREPADTNKSKHGRPHGKAGRSNDDDDDARPAKKAAPRKDTSDATRSADPDAETDTDADGVRDREDAVRDDAGEDAAKHERRDVAARDEAEPQAEPQAEAEAVARTGDRASGRAWRLTAALGGGLVLDHGDHGLLAVAARLESSGRTRLGGEAALWLAGGRGAEGRALLTVARGLSRWLELGFGAGVQLGDGTGIAGALRLRVDTPIRALAGFARYDTAAIVSRPALEARQAITFGVELSY